MTGPMRTQSPEAASWPQAAAAARPRLVALAYRMLGSVADAEDAVQQALERFERHDPSEIRDPTAWLARVTSRICLDQLRSARARREVYVGPWLPEPIVAPSDPVEDAETLSMAFLVVLETLTPLQRVGFLLHDVFGAPYEEVAAALDRSEAACRKLVSRARAAVAARPRLPGAPEADENPAHPPRRLGAREEADEVAARFVAACQGGDLERVLELLAPEVTLVSDGGGVVSAARAPLAGPDRVGRFCVGIAGRMPADATLQPVRLNAAPGLVVRRPDGTPEVAFVLAVDGGLVAAVYAVRNPAKLGHL